MLFFVFELFLSKLGFNKIGVKLDYSDGAIASSPKTLAIQNTLALLKYIVSDRTRFLLPTGSNHGIGIYFMHAHKNENVLSWFFS